MKFGLIPEFIGRLSVTVSLEALDRDALISILTKPKNALVKQYQKLLSYDNVSLDFDKDALEAIADKAIERKTGARGLRSIMEETMGDIMFYAPSDKADKEYTITADMVKSPEIKALASIDKKKKNTKHIQKKDVKKDA